MIDFNFDFLQKFIFGGNMCLGKFYIGDMSLFFRRIFFFVIICI
jgi:hypothetical protein